MLYYKRFGEIISSFKMHTFMKNYNVHITKVERRNKRITCRYILCHFNVFTYKIRSCTNIIMRINSTYTEFFSAIIGGHFFLFVVVGERRDGGVLRSGFTVNDFEKSPDQTVGLVDKLLATIFRKPNKRKPRDSGERGSGKRQYMPIYVYILLKCDEQSTTSSKAFPVQIR